MDQKIFLYEVCSDVCYRKISISVASIWKTETLERRLINTTVHTCEGSTDHLELVNVKNRDTQTTQRTRLMAGGRNGLASAQEDAVQAANLWKGLETSGKVFLQTHWCGFAQSSETGERVWDPTEWGNVVIREAWGTLPTADSMKNTTWTCKRKSQILNIDLEVATMEALANTQWRPIRLVWFPSAVTWMPRAWFAEQQCWLLSIINLPHLSESCSWAISEEIMME